MKLSVTHKTTFQYASPVTENGNTLHLEPRRFPHQKTLSSLIRVLPATRLRRFTDLFENITHHFEVAQPHQHLLVESRLKVDTLPPEPDEAARLASIYELHDPAIREVTWLFLQESRYVEKSPDLWRQAIDLTANLESVHQRAWAILDWIHSHFLYQPGTTAVSTHVEEAFHLRSGVCQDFTHVMIALCRAAELPARYVSGYLYNGPQDTLLGSQASHAWCEIYLPHAGWTGYDPTNGRLVDERYVKISVGRDYDDVAPVRGSYHGTSDCLMNIEVLVERF